MIFKKIVKNKIFMLIGKNSTYQDVLVIAFKSCAPFLVFIGKTSCLKPVLGLFCLVLKIFYLFNKIINLLKLGNIWNFHSSFGP